MKSGMKIGVLLSFGLALVLSMGSAHAHEGHAHTAMGTVVAISKERLDVKTTEGKTLTFVLSADTEFDRAGKAETPEHVAVAERVVVHYQMTGGKNVAQHVQLAAQAASPKTAALELYPARNRR